MSKYDLSGIVTDIKKRFAKEPRRAAKVGLGSAMRKLTDSDFIIMPEWWSSPDGTNTKGIALGRITMLAGDSDSGKTSGCIVAMKAALEQGCIVIYVETESKTTPKDLAEWGVDPDQVILIQSTIAEEAFELMFDAWDHAKDKYPDAKLLVIFDSLGNTVSLRDSEIDLIEQSQRPGGKGAINRLAISKLVAKKDEDNAAILFVNYTYDNIGSAGKTNAGGKAVNFFSSLTYQTTRVKWLEKEQGGRTIRIGARVAWKLYKNHIDKSNPGPKEVVLDITAEGVKLYKPEKKKEEAKGKSRFKKKRETKPTPEEVQDA